MIDRASRIPAGKSSASLDTGLSRSTRELVTCRLPTAWGEFTMHAKADSPNGEEHVALSMGRIDGLESVLTRVHSECLSGDTLFSLRCDCGPQLQGALRAIASEGRGLLLYLRQEGRGIGLVNKIRAYALQQTGSDTVDANRLLGLPDDARDYAMAAELLTCLGVQRIRLLTNNPLKVEALLRLGIDVTERVPLRIAANKHNVGYLQTKRRRMGHFLDIEPADEQAER
jgi:GTP cyclohydrolase II